MADGWAVEVTMEVVGGGESKQIYYAHCPVRAAAEEVVKRHISAAPNVKVHAKECVPHDAFVSMDVPEGGVGQWT
jgi:hypothetical protein